MKRILLLTLLVLTIYSCKKNDLSEEKVKDVITKLIADQKPDKYSKIIGIKSWDSELRLEDENTRYIMTTIHNTTRGTNGIVDIYSKSKFFFKKIDGKWYLKGGTAQGDQFGYSLKRWISKQYMEIK